MLLLRYLLYKVILFDFMQLIILIFKNEFLKKDGSIWGLI